MALEDAVALSELTARIQIGSRQLGDNWFHVDGVHSSLRNEIMSGMSEEEYYSHLQ